MPIVPKPVSDRRIAMTRLAIIITVTAWISYFVTWLLNDFLNPIYSSTTSRAESIIYLLIITMLTASALAYLLQPARLLLPDPQPPPGQPGHARSLLRRQGADA